MAERHEAWLSKPPKEVTLGMSAEELLAPSKKKNSKPKPPRPQQSFILFRKNFRTLNKSMKFEDVSAQARMEWKTAPPVVREYFEMLSGEAKKRHSIKYPNYKYEPRRNPDVFKRHHEVQRPRRRRQRQSVPSFPVIEQSSPEAPQKDTSAGMDFELSSFVVDNFINMNHMYYNTSTFSVDQPTDASNSPTSSTTSEDFTAAHDDDGWTDLFDFDFYTNDDNQ